MNAATLLLITTLTVPTHVLVLRSGRQIDVTTVRQENGRIVFTTPAGSLYSLPVEEIDVAATNSAGARESQEEAKAATQKKLKVSEEQRKALLAELEQNHSGVPAPLPKAEPLPPAPTLEQVAAKTEDEWTWRRQANTLRESVRQARENRDLLKEKAAALRSHISGLISLGYKPRQFSYDTTTLQLTVEQIPYAELAVTQAERALADFLEETRQRGIPPGWVR